MHKWLADHPRVSRFAIIDDEDDGLDDLPLFQLSSKLGVTRCLREARAEAGGHASGRDDLVWLLRINRAKLRAAEPAVETNLPSLTKALIGCFVRAILYGAFGIALSCRASPYF